MNRDAAWRPAGMSLLLAFAILYLATLGIRPLATPDEFRYAEIAREMLISGDWVTPRLDGVRYFEKPILGHWLNAASLAAFGTNAFAARLPSALATGLIAMFMFGFLRVLSANMALALGTSGILLSSLAIWATGGMAVLDAIFTLWLTLTMGLYYLSYVAPAGSRRRLLQALVGLCCALAFLTKGFLALAIPVLIVVPFLCWQRNFRRLLDDTWLPVLAAAAVILPWSLLIQWREPDFWHYFFWQEHIHRFLSNDAQHRQPFWLYIAALPVMALPWSCFAPAALAGLRRPSPDRRLLRFAWLWFLMPLLFFSASRGKLPLYILPCFPPLALLVAEGIARYRESGRSEALRWGAVFLAVLFGASAVYLLGNGFGLFGEPLFTDAGKGRWLLAVAAFAWGMVVAGIAARQSGGVRVWTIGLTMLGVFLAAPFIVPDPMRAAKMPGAFFAAQRALVPPDAVLVVTGGLASSVAWVFQRNDLYVFDAGELTYGMSQPDAAGRGLCNSDVGRLVQTNAGRRDVVIVTWTEKENKLRPYMPSTARRVQNGEVTLWQIKGAGALVADSS